MTRQVRFLLLSLSVLLWPAFRQLTPAPAVQAAPAMAGFTVNTTGGTPDAKIGTASLAGLTEPNGLAIPILGSDATPLDKFFMANDPLVHWQNDAAINPGTFIPKSSLTVTLKLREATLRPGLSWYNANGAAPKQADLHLLIPANSDLGTTASGVDILNSPDYQGGAIAFALMTQETGLRYTEPQWNVKCTDCSPVAPWILNLIYASKQNALAYYLCFEDGSVAPNYFGNDGDFNDQVFLINGIEPPPPTVTLTATDPNASEAGDTGTIHLERSHAIGTLSIALVIDNASTAQPDECDYSFTGGAWLITRPRSFNVTLGNGETGADISVTAIAEAVQFAEGPETITFAIIPNNFIAVDPANSSATVTIAANGFTVVNTNSAGEGSLRQAIENANANPGQDTITFAGEFADAVVPDTINLAGVLPNLTDSLAINGPGARALTVRRNTGGDYRIFTIGAGLNVALNGLTISNGKVNGFGGGILSQSNLTLTACAITGNEAVGQVGGGVHLLAANGVFTGCTFSGNTAGQQGGGINYEGNDGHTLQLIHCTISGNTANGNGLGGGIEHVSSSGASTLEVTACTIANNTSATTAGGGLRTASVGTGNVATTRLRNTLVAGNTAPNFRVANSTGGGPSVLASLGANLDSGGSSGFTNGVNGDQVGAANAPLRALLAPLANNGGATDTHALLPGSPALDAGNDCVFDNSCLPNPPGINLMTDQRGFNRKSGGHVDIGAFESRGFTLMLASGNNQTASVFTAFAAPLVVAVGSAFNEPVQGGEVTFTAPANGASATLSGANPATTGSNGQASISATANLQAGSYQVLAGANGLTGVMFNLTNACPSFTVGTPPATGALGVPYNSSVAAMPAAPPGLKYQYSLANGTALPTGLALDANTGAISGTPTVSGNFSFDIKVELLTTGNAATNCSVTQTRSLSITCVSNPIVQNLNDGGPGSLREALATACAGSTITFAPNLGGTLMLTSGQLVIDKPLTILGPGASVLTISGNHQSRVFQIIEAPLNVTLSGLTIANGYVKGLPDANVYGGGLENRSAGTVDVLNCSLTGNVAEGGDAGGGILSEPGGGFGGAIAQRGQGRLNIRDSRLTNNQVLRGASIAQFGTSPEGGAVFCGAGTTVSISRSSFSNNSGQLGGAISNRGSLFIAASTVANNQGSFGGGIHDAGNDSTLINTTISGNRADSAGGLVTSSSSRVITNCTITDNHSDSGQGGGEAGGIFGNFFPPIQLKNTIIAGNTAVGAYPDSRIIATSLGNNLIGDGTGTTGLTNGVNGDQVGTAAAPLAARLGPLADNGGPTQTHALLPGSPAIDKGAAATDPSTNQPLATDQRGQARPYDFPAVNNAVGGNGSDIGAYEYNCATLTLAALPNGTAGVAYNQALNPGGGLAPYTVSQIGGTLPPGLSLTANSLSGTPAIGGTFSFVLAVTDAYGCTGSQSYTLTVSCPTQTLMPTTLPNGVQGTAYNQTLTVNPTGTTYSYAVTVGALPPGLTLTPTGTLSGTPSAGGNYAFGVTATGWGTCTKTQSYNLLITGTCATVTVNPATLAAGTVGAAYAQTFAATVGGNAVTATFSVTQGVLPPGLTLDANSGTLTGTPTTGGTYSFRLTATVAGGCTGSRSYLVTVGCGALTFVPDTLPNGLRGVAYSQQLSLNVGGNVTFSLLLGSLPPGFTLSSTGLLSGITSQANTYNFTVKVVAGTCQASKPYTLLIGAGGNNKNAALALSGDYDGDGQSDPALWSAKDGTWRILNSSDGQPRTERWGTAGDVTLLGDYDGDGKSDWAVFRPADGTFYVKRSSDGSTFVKAWGLSTDIPVPGDYDGDGKTDIAVWRGATGTWFIVRSSDGQHDAQAWGAAYAPYFDVPVSGDYDGDGKSDLAVFRRSTGTWLIKHSRAGQYFAKQWGMETDVPVANDYDGDGKTDIAVWRGASGVWYIWQSVSDGPRIETWGTSVAPYFDQVTPHDYDGDGKADLGVWRASEQAWYIKCSAASNMLHQPQGRAGDVLVGLPHKP